MWKADKLGYKGNTNYNRAYEGDELVWEKQQPGPGMLRLESLQNGSTVGLNIRGVNLSILQYSLDGTTWNNLTTSTSITLNTGNFVYIRGKQTRQERPLNNGYTTFKLTGKLALKGNIMHLYDYEHPENTVIKYTNSFPYLFEDCTALYDVSEFYIPNITFSFPSYKIAWNFICFFMNCTNIQEGPIIMIENANHSAGGAFQNFFSGCSALKKITTHFTNYNSTFFVKWLEGASSTGDFYNLGGAPFERSTDGIPTGWTEHITLD